MPPVAQKSARPASAQKTTGASSPAVEIHRIEAQTVDVPIVGTTPLIMHRFSEKAKRQMLDAQQGRKTPKQPKDPEAEYLAAAYMTADGRYGFPSVAFKAATVGAARFYGKDVKMTELRQSVFTHGELSDDGQPLVVVEGEPEMREDVVRVGNGGTDLRYRPMFREWSAVLQITFVTAMLSLESLLSLVDAGGMGVGVGEWRPERKGDFGCYKIDPSREVVIENV